LALEGRRGCLQVSATWTAWRTAAVDASGSVCGSTTPVPTRAAGAMPAGHRPSSPHMGVRGLRQQRFRSRVRPRAYELAPPRGSRKPRQVHSGGRRAGGGRTSVRAEPSPRTSFLATDSSLVTCAGHHPSGQWSFRTVVVPDAADGQSADRSDSLQPPLRFLQGRPCGRPPAALRPAGDHRTRPGRGCVRGCYFTVTVMQSLISTWVPSVLITRKTMSN
jgi:hypothetical protein